MSALTSFFWGTGRRKTALARVRIRVGEGKIEINNGSGTFDERDIDFASSRLAANAG